MNSKDLSFPDSTVLVVDLDGTLCRTDTLHEALLGITAQSPAKLLAVLGHLRHGRAAVKSHLASFQGVAANTLPYNVEVLELVRRAKAEGRKTALVTASHQLQANAVAESVGLFDEVIGTSSDTNLKGKVKAEFLVERYGINGFDYVGDSKADLPVWKAARKAITVGVSSGLAKAAAAANPDILHLTPPTGRVWALLRAVRPHQWSKNTLLFLPVLAAHEASAIGNVVIGFVAFCLTASAAYVVNDLLDLQADRAHPRKRSRPFAAGVLPATTGLALVGVLLLAALIFAAFSKSALFLAVLALYFATTIVYSLSLKRKLLVDVLTLAGLYTMRIIAGGAATGIVISPWMLGFSMFLFLALAAVKRQAELIDQIATGREKSGRAYSVDDLPILRGIGLSASHAAVLVMALYVSSSDVQVLYTRPELLWLVCPLLLYWLLRMVLMTHRGYMTDDPIIFAAKDRVSLLVILLSLGLLFAAAA